MLTTLGRVVLGSVLTALLSVTTIVALFVVLSSAPEGINDYVLLWGAGLLLSVAALGVVIRSLLVRGLIERGASPAH